MRLKNSTGWSKASRRLTFGLGFLLAFATLTRAQTWTPLAHQPSFSPNTALLLTDGTVMVQATESGNWWRLTPDNTGSYVNGTWSQLASMPSGYGPLYYASAVLPDGRVVVEGGEYNLSGGPGWITKGAIYDPASNTWTSITPPAGWNTIGDAQGIVIANGTFMLANCCTAQAALLDPSALTWTSTGTGKADGDNDEEGWTLLPNGKVLTVDANNTANLTLSEVYDPATGGWSSAGSTIVKLADINADGSGSREIGPAVLRPDGTVFATGGTSNTAIYNTANGSWAAGPSFANGTDIADGPAALLPNGNVLLDASPGIFHSPSSFFEFDGTNLIAAPNPPNAGNDPSYVGRMLVLPTGQILFTDSSLDVELYTASGTFQNAWRPTISSFPFSLAPGTVNYSISGTQFNGLSQGSAYGDDAQAATNYPLVRITNNATGHVRYAKTHSHSTMAVATGSAMVSTQFDVPADIETGPSTLEVVANGIPSVSASVVVGVPSPLRFIAVTPCRIADTRNPNGAFGGPSLSGGVARGFTIPDSACGIPATAQAYSMNATVVPKVKVGFLTMFPCGQALPLASTLNSIDGRIKAGAAIVPAGTNGGVCAYSTDDTDLVIDIDGYFVPATDASALAFFPLTPCRLVDTRRPAGALGGPALVGSATRTFPILSSSCNVPAAAQAYSLNFASVPQGNLGFLTTWPAGQTQPLVSTLNAPTGAVTANAAIVPAGTNGDVSVFVTNDSNLVIDINGYFAPMNTGGLSLFSLTPCRVLDTRNPSGSPAFSGTLNVNVAGSGCGAPVTAQSFVLNATVVPPGPLGFLTLWAQGATQPLVSTLNAGDGAVTSNMAIVPASNGLSSAFAPDKTHLVLDISGYFAP
jgi:hypothetical protein